MYVFGRTMPWLKHSGQGQHAGISSFLLPHWSPGLVTRAFTTEPLGPHQTLIFCRLLGSHIITYLTALTCYTLIYVEKEKILYLYVFDLPAQANIMPICETQTQAKISTEKHKIM